MYPLKLNMHEWQKQESEGPFNKETLKYIQVKKAHHPCNNFL